MANRRCNVAELQPGDILSETQYYTVQHVDGLGQVAVKNERGLQFTIGKTIVEEGIYSASQYETEEKVNRTQLIEILSNVGDTVFTAVFNKQPTAKEINEGISAINKGKILKNTEIAKVVKDAFDGTERTIRARLISVETGFGRSKVIDLDIERGDGEWDNRIRQIDHRSIRVIIWKGTKYYCDK